MGILDQTITVKPKQYNNIMAMALCSVCRLTFGSFECTDKVCKAPQPDELGLGDRVTFRAECNEVSDDDRDHTGLVLATTSAGSVAVWMDTDTVHVLSARMFELFSKAPEIHLQVGDHVKLRVPVRVCNTWAWAKSANLTVPELTSFPEQMRDGAVGVVVAVDSTLFACVGIKFDTDHTMMTNKISL